ncbi:MAG: hypothetical protein WAK60_00345, partial [Sedimentisphaerales bacterium]
IEGGGQFPAAFAGKWKDKETEWEFVFEPDGTISSAVIDSGFMPVVPSKRIAQKPMIVGKALFKLGQWTVQYSPASRELGVEVVVDFFHIDIGETWLEGNRIDWFTGIVSEDYKTWHATWTSFPTFTAYIPAAHYLPVDPNNTVTDLLFEKVADTAN